MTEEIDKLPDVIVDKNSSSHQLKEASTQHVTIHAIHTISDRGILCVYIMQS